MLLSEDGRDACLCDFGHAERLDNGGQSLSGSKGKYILGLKAILEEAVVQNWGFKWCFFIPDLKGSETHMAPEIVKGEPRGAKADVWSSCCMFLHMLSGCQPWTRYYSCRLYLKVPISAIRHSRRHLSPCRRLTSTLHLCDYRLPVIPPLWERSHLTVAIWPLRFWRQDFRKIRRRDLQRLASKRKLHELWTKVPLWR